MELVHQPIRHPREHVRDCFPRETSDEKNGTESVFLDGKRPETTTHDRREAGEVLGTLCRFPEVW